MARDPSVPDIEAEKDLKEEALKLAEIVRHSQEMVNLARVDGKMIYLNESGSRMLGIDVDSLVGHTLYDVISPECMELVKNELVPSIMNRGVWKGDLRYVNLKTGERVDAYATCFSISDPESSDVKYLANVSVDITERKRAEAVLRSSELRFKAFYDSIADGMANTDADGKILDCNEAFLSMLGYEREELIGLSYKDITPAKWHEAEAELLSKTVFNKGRGEFEKEYVRKDGSVIPISVRYWLVRNDRGEPAGIWALARDMSDDVSVHSQLKKKMSEVERLNRFMIGRESRIIEVKKEVNELLDRLGEPPRYKV